MTSPAAQPPGPSRGYRAAVVVREIVLWMGSAVGVLCLVTAAAALFFGVTPLVFRSGSMSPGIPTGALALARTTPVADLRPGDVVSVIRADGERVTHRLVSATADAGGRSSLVIKGDANAAADPEPVVTRSVDRVFWSTPRIGYLVQGASRPQVLLPLGALFGVLIVVGFRPPLDKRLLRDPASLDEEHEEHEELEQSQEPAQSHEQWQSRAQDPAPAAPPAPSRLRGGALGLALVVVAAGSAFGLHATGTLAAFADAGSTTASFATGSVAAPATFTCSIVGGKVRFAWSLQPAPLWTPGSFVITNTSTGFSTTVSDPAATTIDITPPLVSVGGLTSFTYAITSRLGSSSATATQTRTVTAVLGMAPTCG